MKRVFSNHAEVCHIWAQRMQDEGKGKNVFFEGDSIFSYGKHFEIARFVDVDNKTVVLFNEGTYSVSTAKHKNHVYHAVTHYKIFTIPSFDSHEENVKYYLDRINDILTKAVRAIKHTEFYFNCAVDTLAEVNDYLSYFEKNITDKKLIFAVDKLNHQQSNNELINNDLKGKIKKQSQEKREKEKIKKLLLLDSLKEWQDGGDSRRNLYNLPIALRIKGENVETSHGANVPIKDVLNLLYLLEDKKDVAGFHIGNYTVNSLTDKLLIVGCHKIPLTEVLKIQYLLTRQNV